MPHRADPDSGRPSAQATGPASDEQLLRAVREGDTAAFGELYERHRGAALAVARMHSRNDADAQDLVSEAFTRVLALLREGKGPREFLRAYVVTAVSRLAADRANDLTRTRPEDPKPDGPLDRVELFDDSVVRQVDAAVVARAFASLPERWQEVLWYLEVEQRRPRQVAPVVGVQPNAVSALGKRAREGLRAAYVQEHVSAQALEDCHQYSSQLGAFTRGSLTPARTRAVQQHLDQCCRCTAEYLQLQDLGLGMRAWVLPVLAALPLWSGAGSRLADSLGALPLLGAFSGAATQLGAPSDGTAQFGSHDAAAAASGAVAPVAAELGAVGGSTAAPATVAASGSTGGATGAGGGVAAFVGSGTGLVVAVGSALVLAASAVGLLAWTSTSQEADPVAASASVSEDAGRSARPPAATGSAGTAADEPSQGAPGPVGASGPAGAVEPEGEAQDDPQPGTAAEPGAPEAAAPRPESPVAPAPFLPGQEPALPGPVRSLPMIDPTSEPTPEGSQGTVDPSPSPSPEATADPTPSAGDTAPPATPSPSPTDQCDWVLGLNGEWICFPWVTY
ncbi:sigma-70 family RNA polymerase sigma factor [Kocuria rhizophila]|uniref:Sigma-70 family RNA polymerase sigma factor n=1 Tax=Kocuria rhizophila TaxID=72000 RepID=A0AAX2SIR4_KOCRH|nr:MULTISPECIES: sigma-70 family RNA polymerase sigma factor [Kocuria]WIW69184.1 sigma-70 family RNA polymerase sigma factor [Kocuria sp. ChxB]MCT1546493.1 sigma-70 family RNA polymerase sigma factor [Kocuria rhizophila]MCT1916827.1 sigma-70 family RNA polymerase sigma factor [Kocuria rhizophila]MCT2172641.1 sigma-70 family RNA polymerase sigma factor [Kocuria rhizophila]MDN3463182.1 sigma-70 family RNA polymerase sigma factor [Kocuria sp. APC 4018]